LDFTGTGPEVYGSTNAPPAVTLAAVIYSIRCLVGHNIPLNQGCLVPINIHIPKGNINKHYLKMRMNLGTILNADSRAAVVGGNVLTSQRIVDVILRAFSACAASQVHVFMIYVCATIA
jgi:5-oxoprolinase (ATP-hydrolysing)